VIDLRPLREDEYGDWDAAHRAEYERGLVEHVGMPPEQAKAKVELDVSHVLPNGLATAGTWIWAVEDDGRVVGTVFVGIRDGGAWLYDITIAEGDRGKGYGRAAMTALEDEVRALGHETIGLNVWGGNDVARGLYRSLGWAEESVHMRKAL
jgi:ribosomal protein S18 acetylase RimI-like enzyme